MTKVIKRRPSSIKRRNKQMSVSVKVVIWWCYPMSLYLCTSFSYLREKKYPLHFFQEQVAFIICPLTLSGLCHVKWLCNNLLWTFFTTATYHLSFQCHVSNNELQVKSVFTVWDIPLLRWTGFNLNLCCSEFFFLLNFVIMFSLIMVYNIHCFHSSNHKCVNDY